MSATSWTKTTLGEVAEVVGGATPKTSVDDYWDGDVYWATPKDLSELEGAEIDSTPRTLTQSGLRSCSARVLPPGSVLLSSRAPIGHVAINTVPMATNQGFKSLIPDRGRVDAKFLYWWLRRNRPALEGMGTGATFKEISKKTVAAVPIQLPPIEEQRRIAQVLDAADELRAKRRQALAKLDTLTQATFIEAFGLPSQNVHGFPGHVLGDLVEVKGGKRLPKGADYADAPTAFPYVRVTDFKGGSINVGGMQFLTPEVQETISRYTVDAGDVVISIAGSIGEVASVPEGLHGANLTENAAKLVRRDPSRLHTEYLAAFLKSPYAQAQIAAQTGQVTIGKLALFRIAELPILLPPMSLQQEYASTVAKIARQRQRLLDHGRALCELLASLQQRAFRGAL